MNLPTLSIPKISTSADVARFLTLAAPVAAILVSAFVLLLVVRPKFVQVLKLRSENRELAVRVSNLQVKAEKLANLNRDELDSQLGAAEQILPATKDVFSLVRQVETIAGSAGVLLNRVEVAPGSLTEVTGKPAGSSQAATQSEAATQQVPGGAKETEPASKIQLKVSVTSDYKSFLQFLNTILALPRVLAVRDLTLSSSALPGEAAQIRTLLTIDAYWLPLPAELASIETPIEELTESELARIEKAKLSGFVGSPVVPAVPTGRSDLFAPF